MQDTLLKNGKPIFEGQGGGVLTQGSAGICWVCATGIWRDGQFSKYPAAPELQVLTSSPPLAAVQTEWHILCLFKELLFALRWLDNTCTWSIDTKFDLSPSIPNIDNSGASGTPITIVNDEIAQTYWILTSTTLLEVVPMDEAANISEVYLKQERFSDALLASRTPIQRNRVLCKQAEHLLPKDPEAAAIAWARSDATVESIALNLLRLPKALLIFCKERLTRVTGASQRYMLGGWCVDIWMTVLAEFPEEEQKYELEFTKWIEKEEIKEYLDKSSTYTLLTSACRENCVVAYARAIQDYDRLMQILTSQSDWDAAVPLLRGNMSHELITKWSGRILLKGDEKSKALIPAIWLDKGIDPSCLLAWILQYESSPESKHYGMHYLEQAVQRGSIDVNVHNLLVSLYSRNDISKLNNYFDNPPYYMDLNYALRLLSPKDHAKALIRVHGTLCMFEEAVKIALLQDDVDEAIYWADQVEQMDRRKGLWLLIGKHLLARNEIEKCMTSLPKDPVVITLADLLPHFPETLPLSTIHQHLIELMENYQLRLAELDDNIRESSESAEAVRKEIAGFQKRWIEVNRDSGCELCHENLTADTSGFYGFPCTHLFHIDCLISHFEKKGNAAVLDRLLPLKGELHKHRLARTKKVTNAVKKSSSSIQETSKAAIATNSNVSPASQMYLNNNVGSNISISSGSQHKLQIPRANSLVNSFADLRSRAFSFESMKATLVGTSNTSDSSNVEPDDALMKELDGILGRECILCSPAVVDDIIRGFEESTEEIWSI